LLQKSPCSAPGPLRTSETQAFSVPCQDTGCIMDHLSCCALLQQEVQHRILGQP
jgi:hypothetical protein